MKFRNYCVVIMGDTKGVFKEIEKISDNKPNVLDAKGIVIATFSSALNVKELTDWFKINERNFLLFDLNPNASGYNITKPDINKGLFGFLEDMNETILGEKTKDLLDAIDDAKVIQENSKNFKENSGIDVKMVIKPRRYSESDIDNMTLKEKNELMNQIIDLGVENMREEDKKMLQLLAK